MPSETGVYHPRKTPKHKCARPIQFNGICDILFWHGSRSTLWTSGTRCSSDAIYRKYQKVRRCYADFLESSFGRDLDVTSKALFQNGL